MDTIRTTLITCADPLGHTYSTRVLSDSPQIVRHAQYEPALRDFYGRIGLEVLSIATIEEMVNDHPQIERRRWRRGFQGHLAGMALLVAAVLLLITDVSISILDHRADEELDAKQASRFEVMQKWEQLMRTDLNSLEGRLREGTERLDRLEQSIRATR